jgi:riboflavin kinase/FMN adenylyltransferase
MRVLRSLEELKQRLPAPALTIGNFDGVHRGHQRILAAVVREAGKRGGTAVAITFDPHPARVLHPTMAPPLLLTLEQRLALLEVAGINLALVLPFTQGFSRLSPREFVEQIICHRIRAQVVCVGSTFHFGHRQAGTSGQLKELGKEFGFSVRLVPPVIFRGQMASSTAIRQLLSRGEVARAARLLGRPFALTGTIQRGAGRGRTIGFPTLNIVPDQECLPARGVYATQTVLAGKAYAAATNVGVRPTFDGQRLMVESHLLNFSQTIGQGCLEVRFYRRLRPEKKFSSAESLRRQIERDVERTQRLFARAKKSAASRRRVPATG